MFDLTKEIKLESLWQKRYQKLRILLYFLFVGLSVFFIFKIILPSQYFSLDLKLPINKNNSLVFDGVENQTSFFSAYSKEDFSSVNFQIILKKTAPALRSDNLLLRKTFKALTYPTTIASPDTLEDSIVAINSANGTLFSFDNTVFLVTNNKAMPFDNQFTFTSLGYQWNDVRPASEGEIGLYQRDKLFTINQPHPEGTIFKTRDSNKYFLIRQKSKIDVTDLELWKSAQTRNPILVDEESLNFKSGCKLAKNIWPLHSYDCSIAIDDLSKFLGNAYQFALADVDAKDIQRVNIVFSRHFNWNNARDTLSDIKHKILVNYGLANPY